MIATRSRTPVIITRTGFQLICLMGRVSENKTLHRHLFQVIPSNALRQSHLVLTIFYEESRNHGEVGIRANTILIILHGTITLEGTTCLIHRIWRSTILEVILQILGEFSQHIYQVTLHGSLIHKLIVDYPFYRTGHTLLCRIFRLYIRCRKLIQTHMVNRNTTAARYPIDSDTDIDITRFTHFESHFLGSPFSGSKAARFTFFKRTGCFLTTGKEGEGRSSTAGISRANIRSQLIFTDR